MTNHVRRRAFLISLLITQLIPLAVLSSPAGAEELTPTTTSLTATYGEYGDPFTLTAKVTSATGTPTGTVTFSMPWLGDVPVDASGVATTTFVADFTGTGPVTATFHGANGFADSIDTVWYYVDQAEMVLHPEPTVLRVSPLALTLTMSATARRKDGRPIAGETLYFKVGGKDPDLPFSFGGGRIVCWAVTDAQGFATCRGSGFGGALESITKGGGYVFRPCCVGFYYFTWAKMPVLLLGDS